jgi:very-short-patch-repair endonuclease
MYEYKEASEVIRERIEREPEVFDSAHEMVAAIELLRNYVHLKLQTKIGRYRVDMTLPDHRVALEIDGELHEMKSSRIKDKERDIKIRSSLEDLNWEIVRIPTKFIDRKVVKLLPAIMKIKSALRNTIICKESRDPTSLTYRKILKEI